MGIQTQWLILGQNSDRINSGIDAVTQREIDNAVLSSERNCRFGNLRCTMGILYPAGWAGLQLIAWLSFLFESRQSPLVFLVSLFLFALIIIT